MPGLLAFTSHWVRCLRRDVLGEALATVFAGTVAGLGGLSPRGGPTRVDPLRGVRLD
jgi:hypothetical protein